jgi:hypothetical protein
MNAGVDYQSNLSGLPQPPATLTANANSSPKRSPNIAVAQSRFVTPAANNIQLTNPAAKNVQKTMDEDLQQAIYYEASDGP